MRRLRWISYALTGAGIVLALAGMAGLGAGFVLTGILLAFAGIVKIAVVAIWSRVPGFDSQPVDHIRESRHQIH